MKAWKNSNVDSLRSLEPLICTYHPSFIIEKKFELNQSISGTGNHNVPDIWCPSR